MYPWADGIEVSETLTIVLKGSRVDIQVTNPTKHPIVLRKRTVLGGIQFVTSMTPLEEKQVPESDQARNDN